MTSLALEFDRPDLSAWLWLALGAGLLLEGVRLARASRRRPGNAHWTAAGVLLAIVGIYVLARPAGSAFAMSGRGHLPPLAGLAVLAAIWARRAYARTTRPITAARRSLLIALRAATLICLLAMLSAPVLQWTHQARQRSLVAVVLDDSASMSVRDIMTSADPAAPAVSRLQAVEAALRRAGEAIAHAESTVDLEWLQFSDQVQKVRWPRLEAEGTATALLDVLGQVHTQYGSLPQRLAATIVISDGRDNASGHTLGDTADVFSSAGVPLYVVGVGSETPSGETRSLIGRRLDCPPVVSLLNAFPIHAEFYAAGLADASIEITIQYDDQVVRRETLRPAAAGELLRINAAHVPETEGLHRLVVQARAPGLEEHAGSAVLSAFVQVVDDQTRVAYIDRPRYERAAIARALTGSKTFQLVRMDVLPFDRREEIDWRAFSAVLLGDIDRGTFSPREIDTLRRLVVETGKGIALLGGVRTLGSGALAGSPLVDLLPVDLSATGQIDARVPITVTPAGRLHPILSTSTDIGDDAVRQPQPGSTLDPAQFWAGLPPFIGASRLAGMKLTAEVLLASPAQDPLLVVQELGRGRSAVVAFDSTWRWALASDQGAQAQKRFWRQLVLWLTNRRPQVWVNVEKPRYLLNRIRSGAEHVQIRSGATAGLSAASGVRMEGTLTYRAVASAPAAAHQPTELTWTRAGEVFEHRPQIDAPGEYHVNVRASDASGTIGEAQAAFVVESPDLEWLDPLADLASLRRLAEATSRQGGAYIPLDRLEDVFDRLASTTQTSTTQRIERLRLVADHPWGWLTAFVLLLAAEWIVRRRSGLV